MTGTCRDRAQHSETRKCSCRIEAAASSLSYRGAINSLCGIVREFGPGVCVCMCVCERTVINRMQSVRQKLRAGCQYTAFIVCIHSVTGQKCCLAQLYTRCSATLLRRVIAAFLRNEWDFTGTMLSPWSEVDCR